MCNTVGKAVESFNPQSRSAYPVFLTPIYTFESDEVHSYVECVIGVADKEYSYFVITVDGLIAEIFMSGDDHAFFMTHSNLYPVVSSWDECDA